MDEICLKIQELLAAAFTNTFKKYYYGDVRVPAQAELPILQVVGKSSQITNRGTGGMMTDRFKVEVTIKDTLKGYLTSATNKTILGVDQQMKKWMEERNSDWTLKDATVVGVLHSKLQLEAKCHIVGDWNIRYGEEKLGESWIVFATVEFMVERIV